MPAKFVALSRESYKARSLRSVWFVPLVLNVDVYLATLRLTNQLMRNLSAGRQEGGRAGVGGDTLDILTLETLRQGTSGPRLSDHL